MSKYENPDIPDCEPEEMSLSNIIVEMIDISIKNPKLFDLAYTYSEEVKIKAGINKYCKRFGELQSELMKREEKYLRFEELYSKFKKFDEE